MAAQSLGSNALLRKRTGASRSVATIREALVRIAERRLSHERSRGGKPVTHMCEVEQGVADKLPLVAMAALVIITVNRGKAHRAGIRERRATT